MKQNYDSFGFSDVIGESEADATALRTFKYQGKDNSLLYEYVTSPFCQWLVDEVFPPRLAPNMITLIGLQFVLVPHVLILLSAPNDSDIPWRFLYFLNGFGTILYSVSQL